MTILQRNILVTLAYYDTMDYPLTAFEVWKYLIAADSETPATAQTASLAAVVTALDTEDIGRRTAYAQGFFMLRGREFLAALRREREARSLTAIRRARVVACILKYLPFVRLAALTGSVAMRHAEVGSDLDFFIVLRRRHMWMGRLLVTGVLHVFGLRRHGSHVANRACLNYWIANDALEVPVKDWFASHVFLAWVPLFGVREYARFRCANVWWIQRFRPNFRPISSLVSQHCLVDTRLAKLWRDVWEVVLGDGAMEQWLGVWQQHKISTNPKTSWPGSLILASDQALLFFPRSRGPQVFEKCKQRLSEVEARV